MSLVSGHWSLVIGEWYHIPLANEGATVVRSKLAAFCREPLVHFLAIGAALFLIWHFFGDRSKPPADHIVITPGHVERIAQQWTRTHVRPPSAEELAGLVEQEIDDEILYREALALGLDRNDLVIRQRLAVKMDFLTDDLAAETKPTDAQLRAFLRQHPETFKIESLTTFGQVYIDRSKRGEGASAEAKRLLTVLNSKASSDWQTLGDPLPLPSKYKDATTADVARAFGRKFAGKLSGLAVGRWSGPVESGYGLHLVLVRKRTAGRIPPLNEVRGAVVTEWRLAKRQELKADLRRQRRAKYTVTVQWPDWAKRSGVSGEW
jgi:hypothetical protein